MQAFASAQGCPHKGEDGDICPWATRQARRKAHSGLLGARRGRPLHLQPSSGLLPVGSGAAAQRRAHECCEGLASGLPAELPPLTHTLVGA